jgi:hypothetical protein
MANNAHNINLNTRHQILYLHFLNTDKGHISEWISSLPFDASYLVLKEVNGWITYADN